MPTTCGDTFTTRPQGKSDPCRCSLQGRRRQAGALAHRTRAEAAQFREMDGRNLPPAPVATARAHVSEARSPGTSQSAPGTASRPTTRHHWTLPFTSLLDLVAKTASELGELKPRDRIDVQNFIWVVGGYKEGNGTAAVVLQEEDARKSCTSQSARLYSPP
jgi:hypothetical protein